MTLHSTPLVTDRRKRAYFPHLTLLVNAMTAPQAENVYHTDVTSTFVERCVSAGSGARSVAIGDSNTRVQKIVGSPANITFSGLVLTRNWGCVLVLLWDHSSLGHSVTYRMTWMTSTTWRVASSTQRRLFSWTHHRMMAWSMV